MNTPRFPTTPKRPASAVALWGTFLAVSSLGPAALAQASRPDPLQLDPTPSEPTTTFVESEIPLPAWASPSTPSTPAWAVPHQTPSPFLRPGLGTPSIGNPVLVPTDPRPNPSPLRSGPFDLWPRLSYEVTYGNGLNPGPNRSQSTWLQSINPGFTLGAGSHWTIAYNPSIRIFTLDGYENTVNQAVSLNGQTAYENWRFRFNHATAITSDPLIETAVQTDQTTHSSILGATWDHGSRGTFDFSLAQNIRFSDQFSDLLSWNFQSWYDYPWRPSMRVGLGLGVGYDLMDPGSDMLSERIHVRVSGPLTRKISYSLAAGFETRSFYGADGDPTLSPLVTASVTYQVLDLTSISAAFSHDVGSSYFSDQLTRNTSLQGTLTQILSRRWSASASGGYRFTSYESTQGAQDVSREDGSTFASAALRWQPLPRFSTSLFYGYRANASDRSTFSFDSHQFGLSLSWAL